MWSRLGGGGLVGVRERLFRGRMGLGRRWSGWCRLRWLLLVLGRGIELEHGPEHELELELDSQVVIELGLDF